MPYGDQKNEHAMAANHRTMLASLCPEATLGDVLHAVHTLTEKIDRLEAVAATRSSSLVLDPAEIARTMAQLRIARPVKRM